MSEKLSAEAMASQINERLEGFSESIRKSATQDMLAGVKADMEAFTTKNSESLEGYETKFGDLENRIKEMSNKVSKLPQAFAGERKTLAVQIYEQFKSEEWQKHLENRADGQSPIMEVKSIDWGAITTGGTNDVVQNFMPFDVPIFPFEEPLDMRSILPLGTCDTGSLDYPQELLYTDEMAMMAETGTSTASDVTFEMKVENAHRMATFAEVSRRALRNTRWLASYISNRFMDKFVKLLNTQVLTGDDSGENLNGLMNQATAWNILTTNLPYADTIAAGESTLWDALIAMNSQLYNNSNVYANACFVNPITAYELMVQKATTKEFIYDQNIVNQSEMGVYRINGMAIFPSKDIPAGDALIGLISSGSCELLSNGGITMDTTQSHASNFTSSLVAFRFETDVLFPVYRPYVFLKGTLADVQDDITSV